MLTMRTSSGWIFGRPCRIGLITVRSSHAALLPSHIHVLRGLNAQ